MNKQLTPPSRCNSCPIHCLTTFHPDGVVAMCQKTTNAKTPTKLFTCEKCGAAARKLVKWMCPRCYHAHWTQTSGGRSVVKRKQAARKSMPRADRIGKQGDAGQLKKLHVPAHTDGATAFYSDQSKIPIETQRRIFAMYAQGHEPLVIAREVKLSHGLVSSLIARGVVSPQFVQPYRCPGCRNKVVAMPCFICESRRVHQNSRRLEREVSA